MLTMRLPEELEGRLTGLAKLTGRTKSYYVREALERHLEEMEDVYLADARIRKNEKRYTLEEVETLLGLSNRVQGKRPQRAKKT